MNKNSLLLSLLLAAAPLLPASAATVWLQPAAPSVGENAAFAVDLLLDVADAPGIHPGLIGGEIVLTFDPALLSFQGFTLAEGVTFLSAPVIGTANGNQTVTLGFENAGDVGPVGTFSFITAPGSAGNTATLDIEDLDPFLSTFANQRGGDQPFFPEFIGTSVQIVPLPGAVWLLVSALGVVGARARRQRREPVRA